MAPFQGQILSLVYRLVNHPHGKRFTMETFTLPVLTATPHNSLLLMEKRFYLRPELIETTRVYVNPRH